MNKLSFPIATAILASGCSSAPANKADLTHGQALRDQTIAYTVRNAPRFRSLSTSQTVANAVIDAAGSVVAATRLSPGFHSSSEADAATKAARYGHLVDPASQIAKALLDSLEAERGSIRADGVLAVPDNMRTQDIARAGRGRVRFILDVETSKWGICTFATDWFHYELNYAASARLIDTESGAVVASAVCPDVPDAKASSPNYDQLMIDNAALLKAKLAVAARQCLATLKAGMLR